MTKTDGAFQNHVRAFAELMIQLHREFDRDLDMVVILAVIAERHYANLMQDGMGPGVAINTLSVAQYTGIPRETVRRKVGALVTKGWVGCDARGRLAPMPQAALDLKKGTDASLVYLEAVRRMIPQAPDRSEKG